MVLFAHKVLHHIFTYVFALCNSTITFHSPNDFYLRLFVRRVYCFVYVRVCVLIVMAVIVRR